MSNLCDSDMKLTITIAELGLEYKRDVLSPKRIKRYEDDIIWYRQNLPEMVHEQNFEDFVKSEVIMHIDEMVEEIS